MEQKSTKENFVTNESDARRVIKKLIACASHDSCEELDCEYFCKLHELESLLKYIEGIDIVHCKDCIWYSKYSKGENESDSWSFCRLTNGRYSVWDEFYCAQGERK